MTKQTGLGDNLYVDGIDISGDTGSLRDIAGGHNALPVTGINKRAFERRRGLASGRINYNAWFNKENAHAALKNVHTAQTLTPQLVSYFRGTELGTPVANQLGMQVNYAPTRQQDGSLEIQVDTLSKKFSLDWGVALTEGIEVLSSATDGDAVDGGASTSFGLQAYLHVFAGTNVDGIEDVTVRIEASADGSTGWTEVASFSEITSGTTLPFGARVETARNQTVERFLRYSVTSVEGFQALHFGLSVVKNEILTRF